MGHPASQLEVQLDPSVITTTKHQKLAFGCSIPKWSRRGRYWPRAPTPWKRGDSF